MRCQEKLESTEAFLLEDPAISKMELFVTQVNSFQPLSNITNNCILGVNGGLDLALASCEFLLILVASLGGKIGICTGLLLTWFVFLYFSDGASRDT